MSDSDKAIFLSYARDDTAAARRIADALRSAGLAVWFDENELRGGDQWDAKIRRQIDTCTLFLPIVSRHTQERAKGYFRLEWKLAVDQTHLLAEGVPFLAPVVIDDTREAEAVVPPEFMRVQWTRLPDALPTPQFVEQVRRLLDHKAASVRSTPPMVPGRPRPPVAGGADPGSVPAKSFPRWTWGALTAVVLGVAVALVVSRKPTESPDTKPQTPVSEVRKLVEKAKALQEDYAQDDTQRDSLRLAQQLCQRAVELDPVDGEAWAIFSRVSFGLAGADPTNQTLEQARSQVQRAVQLAPDHPEVRLALADSHRKQGGAELAEAERILRDLIKQGPPQKRVLRMLGLVLNAVGRSDEAMIYYERAAALPGGDAKALLAKGQILYRKQRFAEAEAAVNEALALRPTSAGRVAKINFMVGRGELDAAKSLIETVPASALTDDRSASTAARLWLWRREPEKALAVLRGTPREYLVDLNFPMPKPLLAGYAHKMAGRAEAAEAEWRMALQLLDQRLTKASRDIDSLFYRAIVLALLGEKGEAVRAFRLYEQLFQSDDSYLPEYQVLDAANFYAVLGDKDRAFAKLQEFSELKLRSIYSSYRATAVGLRYNYTWDPLRDDPRLDALIKKLESKQ